jgi:hypothetical protein
MILDISRGLQLQLACIAAAILGGCALTDLDLDGGAKVVSAKLSEQASVGFTLAIDNTEPLELILVYDDGFEEPAPSKEVKWTVDTSRVATIDGDSKLRGRGIGTSTLTARYEDHTASTTVTVFDYPKELEIRTSNRNCAVGQTLTYGLILRYEHGATEDVAARATWSSEQITVATVDAGLVTCLGVGSTRIIAALDVLKVSADVRISATAALSASDDLDGATIGGR